MDQPAVEPTTTTTFVVHFWREWTGTESRWRGCVEHVQTGQRARSLKIDDLLDFVQRFGVDTAASLVHRSETAA